MNTTTNKHVFVIAVMAMLFVLPIAGACTLHFHNLSIHKADSFNWKTHDYITPDSIYIEPEAMSNVSMKRWGYTVKFVADTDDASINYTLVNHKWQNRKVKLYVTGSPKRVLFADNTGTISFSHVHQSDNSHTYIMKPTWKFKDVIDYILSR